MASSQSTRCAVQMSFYGITADYNGPLKPVNAHTDDDRYDMVELGAAGESLMRTSQISYEDAAWLPVNQPVCAVQMSFYGITADYNGPLKPVNAHTDDDRYDMVELGAAGESLMRTSQISYEDAAWLPVNQPVAQCK